MAEDIIVEDQLTFPKILELSVGQVVERCLVIVGKLVRWDF